LKHPPTPAPGRRREFSIVLFIAGILALNYPLLALTDRMILLFGIPLLYLYLFLIWLLLIVAAALIATTPAAPTVDDD
jgi:hypothetical protein